MLVFAALVAGCTHSSDSQNGDASPTAPAGQTQPAPAAPSGPQPATASEAAAALDEADRTGSAAPAQTAPGTGGVGAAGGNSGTDETACVDAWLKERKLDRYGSPEDTMYAGGTPLFDERTGQRTERLPFVYQRHPEAKAACQGEAGGQPAQQVK